MCLERKAINLPPLSLPLNVNCESELVALLESSKPLCLFCGILLLRFLPVLSLSASLIWQEYLYTINKLVIDFDLLTNPVHSLLYYMYYVIFWCHIIGLMLNIFSPLDRNPCILFYKSNFQLDFNFFFKVWRKNYVYISGVVIAFNWFIK